MRIARPDDVVPPWHQFDGRSRTGLEPLWYWMTERMAIWQRRNRGEPKPWTSDPIFQTYRFCNVFRELDVVTNWIAEQIRTPYRDHEHLWFMLAIARTINHPPALLELMDSQGAWPSHPHFAPKHMTNVLQARKDRKQQVYTGAYMIRAESNPKAEWYSWSKQKYICEIVLGRLWEDRKVITAELEATKRLQDAWKLLALNPRYVGWGPFMTYEWVTDLRWTRYLKEASDKRTWANAGPGALRGLARLATEDGKLPKKKFPPRNANDAMQRLLRLAPKYLPDNFGKALELRDIEHSLCEVDKYLRVYHGEGQPRAKFDGLP